MISQVFASPITPNTPAFTCTVQARHRRTMHCPDAKTRANPITVYVLLLNVPVYLHGVVGQS